MKYNGFYFWMFKSPMKAVLTEKYGNAYAGETMKKSKKVYRELVGRAADIGDDNPMAYNELFALAFVAPYIASGKKIPPETVQEMMRRSAQETDAGEWRRVLRLLYYRQQRMTLNPTSVSSVMPESESKVLLHDSFAWSCTIPCSRDHTSLHKNYLKEVFS